MPLDAGTIRLRNVVGSSNAKVQSASAKSKNPLNRNLDLRAYWIALLSVSVARPAFFVALHDFILAYEPTTMDLAGRTGLNSAAV